MSECKINTGLIETNGPDRIGNNTDDLNVSANVEENLPRGWWEILFRAEQTALGAVRALAARSGM